MRFSQIQKNLILNILNLACHVVIGLYYTPYLVNSLGVIAYGIVPLALIINQFISVLTTSLTGALTRFYSIELQQKEYEKASRSLSTSLIVIGGIIILSLPIALFLIAKVDKVFNIPVILVHDAKLLFLFTLCSFFISLLSSVFNITSYAHNRLDFLNVLKIERVVLKFVIVVVLFEMLDKKVWYIGLANFLTEIIILIHSMKLHCKISSVFVKIRWRYFSRMSLVAIGGMAVWTMVHYLGDIGIYRIDNFVVNKFWGTSVSGSLGAITEFGSYLSMALTVVTSLFGPMILIAYAQNNHVQVQKLAMNNTLVVGILSALACGLLSGYSEELLAFWLNPSFGEYKEWLILKLVPLPFFLSSGIFAFSNRAWNIVKYPAIITIAWGCFNVIAMILIANVYVDDFHKAVLVILIVSAVINVFQSYLLNSFFFLRSYPRCKRDFVIISIKIVAVLAFSAFVPRIVSKLFVPDCLIELICFIVCLYLFLLGICFLFVFSRDEKRSLMSLLVNKS